MIPDFDVRLASIVKALEDNIIPAIASDRPLAREQAVLAIGHLNILRDQWAYTESHADLCLADTLAFARELATAPGADRTAALAMAIDRAALASPVGARETWAVRDDVATAIAAVIDAAGEAGSEATWRLVAPIVLRHAEREHDRDRAWFVGMGMDTEAPNLPAIPALFRSRQA